MRTASLFRTKRNLYPRRPVSPESLLDKGPAPRGTFGPPGRPDREFKLAVNDHEEENSAMDSSATYLHWGFILISWPNLLVILGMIALFAVALVVPFPHHDEVDDVSGK